MSTKELNGRCLCGAVKFVARPETMDMGICHCGMCRRWSGGVFMAVECAPGVRIEGKENLGVYVSSDWGERCFCKICGTALFWRMRDGRLTAASAQAFEHPDAFTLSNEIYIDAKPPNYAFANNTKKMTEAEVLAAFASRQD